MPGYILDDPIPETTSSAVANGGVEGFVRAAALSLERRVHNDSLHPGRAPVPMLEIASAFQRSIEEWRTGEIIRAW